MAFLVSVCHRILVHLKWQFFLFLLITFHSQTNLQGKIEKKEKTLMLHQISAVVALPTFLRCRFFSWPSYFRKIHSDLWGKREIEKEKATHNNGGGSKSANYRTVSFPFCSLFSHFEDEFVFALFEIVTFFPVQLLLVCRAWFMPYSIHWWSACMQAIKSLVIHSYTLKIKIRQGFFFTALFIWWVCYCCYFSTAEQISSERTFHSARVCMSAREYIDKNIFC